MSPAGLGRRLRVRLGMRLLACAFGIGAGGGCAAPAVRPAERAASEPASTAELGWRDLALGRVAEAQRRFEGDGDQHRRDPWAAFGAATIAYEHGDGRRALVDYVFVLIPITIVITVVYLWRRNLWINILAHFLTDMVPMTFAWAQVHHLLG